MTLLNRPKVRQYPFPFIYIENFNITLCEKWILEVFLDKYPHIYDNDTLKVEGIQISLKAYNSKNLDYYDGEKIYITFSIARKNHPYVEQKKYKKFNIFIGFSYPFDNINNDIVLETIDFISEIVLDDFINETIILSKENNVDVFSNIKHFLILGELNQYINYETEWIKSTYSGYDEAEKNETDWF